MKVSLFRGKSVCLFGCFRASYMAKNPKNEWRADSCWTQRGGFIFTFPNKLTSDKCLNSEMLSIHQSLLISLKEVEQLLFSLSPSCLLMHHVLKWAPPSVLCSLTWHKCTQHCECMFEKRRLFSQRSWTRLHERLEEGWEKNSGDQSCT